mmetsp:Transcript_46729/g.69109  ORF Transcript_46729/g.69109 Transcript_46729/m.69109 type:complete len:185 (+) Transcript_46729:83-637(+)
MKVNSIAFILASAVSASAFSPQPQQRPFSTKTTLQAHNGNWWSPVAATAVGWTLASQIAVAGMLPANNIDRVHDSIASSPPSTLISAMESKTEPVYEKIDFSFPSYDSKTYGFEQGAEARLSEGTGGVEADKQAEAMKKAEAARLARLEAKREEAKVREAELKLRAKEKKAESARRLKGNFDGA